MPFSRGKTGFLLEAKKGEKKNQNKKQIRGFSAK